MAFSSSSSAVTNGLQATKHHQSQGVSATTTFNGPTAIRNFEDGEVYASTPIAAMHDSPSRLTLADQASSGEFIPKEALDLEEEYGGFSVNSDFLIDSVNQYTKEIINGGSNTGGAEKGKCCTLSKPVTIKKFNPSNQAQQSRSPTASKVTVQPTASLETIQSITQHAAPTGGGTLTHSHSASSIGLSGTGRLATIPKITPTVADQERHIATQRAAPTGGGTLTLSHLVSSLELKGTGPLASLPEITPAVVGQEGRLTDAPITVGHSSDVNSCAVTVNPQFTTLAPPSSMDKISASQHDGRVSPSTRVACPSAEISYPDTAYASTPNIFLQGQAPSTADIDQPLLPVPIARSDSTVGKSYQFHFVHPTRVGPKVTKGEWRVVSNKGKAVQEVPLPTSPPATTQMGIEAITNVGEMEANEVIESNQPYGPKPSNRLIDSTSIGPVLGDPVLQQQVIIQFLTDQVVNIDIAQEQIPLPSSHKAGIVSLSLEDANLDK
ncbi:hypothetical protein F0562_010378 [Nyssa sinensis]|uniref:Uncharacterized protein n=1 Tax=Nyssa sinensis TaxID=561372 RepID=A0A5J5A414_9ASTE|nr:hypothetical protein F0562_010378 [Nyssa sinensis]